MDSDQRKALSAIRFNWALTPDSVWRPLPYHVDGLHQEALGLILDGFEEARQAINSSPIGVALVGSRGTGKTHLLGTVRERVQDQGGYFFLISLLDAGAFWRSACLSILDGLTRQGQGRRSQLSVFLQSLADGVEAPRTVRRAVNGDAPPSRGALDAFVDVLRKADRQVAMDCQDTARALVLLGSSSDVAQDVGYAFLLSNDEEEPGERAAWGIRRAKRSPQEIVRDTSRLLALTGPTVMAVDQLDMLIAQARYGTVAHERGEWGELLLLEQIASGLMSLREMTKRTLSVVSCLEKSWQDIRDKATDTVQDRFREAPVQAEIPSTSLARELVERHLAVGFRSAGIAPPHPTWPVAPDAFVRDALDFTPRELLITVDAHVRSCLRTDEARELLSFRRSDSPAAADLSAQTVALSVEALSGLDSRFAQLRDGADAGPALDPATEDAVVPELIATGLAAWIAEQGVDARLYSQDPLPGTKPPLHARLLRSLDDLHDDEAHWGFRAIASPAAIAVLNRVRNAVTAAGLTEGVSKRRLFILRDAEWPTGPKTAEVTGAFENAGGVRLGFPASDVKILIALRDLRGTEDPEVWRAWCAARRPTLGISFLQAALATAEVAPEVAPDREPERATTSVGPSIVLGRAVSDGEPVSVGLEELRKHTAIFAGSGSGKTVFIRRIVEECALQGVSAIVLDPNNDLARLGDPWPERPPAWDDVDAIKAKEYLDNTDVVVWTPRREAGRPLSFQPLPDFSGVLDDRDEFAAGIDAAVASLAPRAKVDGATTKAQLGQAVLREALTEFARRGRKDLKELIGMLSDLPEGTSTLNNAAKFAADMSQTLAAAMVNDPLFGGHGLPMDPGVLLTPAGGKRARVSVISFVGLPAEEQRQSFVNQLQLALFAWIKQHPAGERPLSGLFVMDEAQTLAPSGALTACTHSTLALASQARKYGLGLVFATQAPKGLHNRIPGNAATQLFGLLNSPVHIEAARNLARAKGSDVPDIARLGVGQFYAAVTGDAFAKLRTPLCLSHHPNGPLTTEEVIERARPR